MNRPIFLEDLPPCVFVPEDPWFGKSFIGDELYQEWYTEALSVIYDNAMSNGQEEEISEDEDDYHDADFFWGP